MPGRFDRLDSGQVKSWFEDVLRTHGPIIWKGGGEGKCRCPFHEDKAPSFSINTEKQTWHCHAGCGGGGLKELASRLNVPPPWGERSPSKKSGGKKTETVYDYRDEEDRLAYQVVRTDIEGEGKKVRQRRPDGNGGWVWKMAGVKPLPYRLPELLAGIKAKRWIFVAEGEKCVDALVKQGLTATTNHGGAKKWMPSLSDYFPEGCHVAIVPDNDKAGIAHANMVADMLAARGCNVRIVDLGYEYVEVHAKDIYDWFEEGHSRDELIELVKAAPKHERGSGGETNDVPLPDEEEPAKKSKPTVEALDYKIVAGYRMNDIGNAQRLIDVFGKDLRYCHKWKKWLVWDGKRWNEDAPYIVTQYAQAAVDGMYADADEIFDYREREDFLEFAVKSGNSPRISAMLTIAQDAKSIPITPDDLDTEKFYLNCANGTVDLRTGYMKAHDRSDLLTKLLPVPWNPTAQCPQWENFLYRIMDGNKKLVEFLRRAIGYSLTGSTREQCLFVLYGTGRNGKSTLLNTIKRLLGEYARQSAAETFMVKKNTSGPGDDVAMLRGARFVTAIETEENQRLAESMVKQLTGGDTVSVRRLYENFFEFEPEFKIFLATNHKPNIRGVDEGIWRRIRLVPFAVRISDDEVDPDLDQKLAEELEGILSWCVQGCLDWKDDGLQEPEEVWGATREYREEMDVLGAFLEDVCLVGKDYTVTSGDLYRAYQNWAEENGERAMSQKALAKRLQERGFALGKPNRVRGWFGLMLSTMEERNRGWVSG